MASRRVPRRSTRRKPVRRRVTVAPYIVPKGRVKSFSAPLMVPTKWVKFIVALFLLPIVLYVFGHELTHALWVWLMGGRVSRFKVGREGGHILTDKNNFLIALSPYFFPLYSILVIALYGALSLFVNMQPYGRL